MIRRINLVLGYDIDSRRKKLEVDKSAIQSSEDLKLGGLRFIRKQ